MRILFVCKHNRFRSKVAEAYFKKINKNKNIKVASAGVFKGFPTESVVVKIGKKLGIKLRRKTNGLDEKYVFQMDLVVIVANNVPVSLFKGKVRKIIVWKIPDTNQNNKKMIEIIMKKIFKKVEELNKERMTSRRTNLIY